MDLTSQHTASAPLPLLASPKVPEQQEPFAGTLDVADAPPATPPTEDVDEQAWRQPEDGGPPLDLEWQTNQSIGLFQRSEDIPDPMWRALRRVFEKVSRAGLKDWEAEWDYTDPSPWFLPRDLELIAREAFRVWYGEGKWQEPFRMACHLQEQGDVDYRIDYLLQQELGATVRPVAKETATRRKAWYGELGRDLRAHAPHFMPPGTFLTVREIQAALSKLVEYSVDLNNLAVYLAYHADLFERRRSKQRSYEYSLR